MIKVENIEVWGFDHAIRGCRNPMNSWAKSDSFQCTGHTCLMENCPRYPDTYEWCDYIGDYIIGENDLDLMRRLYKAGTEHRKYLRQIFVSMDITAPTMWWLQFDTYKIGITCNSCSKMHRIHSRPITIDDFSVGDFEMLGEWKDAFSNVIEDCEILRQSYIKTKDKRYWDMLIRLLPESYNQKRTVTMNYENVVTIIKQRSGHKLDEWNEFIAILKDLPYIKEIMGDVND